MQFTFTDEQEEFRLIVRRFMDDKSPSTEVRKLMDSEAGYDPAVWQQLSEELGLPGIHIPEAYGGQGFGFVELCIVLEEMGRALLCAPYFSATALAATSIIHAGTEEQKLSLLPDIATGKTLATLAFNESSDNWSPDDTALTATATDNGFLLNGEKSYVVDGHIADLLIVVARTPGSTGSDGLSLFTLPGNGDGIDRRLLKSLDPTRKLAQIEFKQAPATLLGELNTGAETLPHILDLAAIALASEMVGGAQKMLSSAIDYAQLRMQFGRLIGSFQAIKHKCADMLLDVELAKSSAYYAAAAATDNTDDLPAVASLSKAYASDTYMKSAAECLQIHGGIGFTWENDTHLYFKRAKSSEVFLGDPNYHRDQLVLRWENQA
ncbi:MAG: acyl-CoA/acyl-ACP dehydrogenase [Gammaproteobacteria bacterium]|nr:acyl-CoA/acyl-ACP dehydrogenase [Gammaproteobacteria bacterium]MBQ0840586.1 acyl-CoA/acyl-ACP dehydrogenase [Gammaproteobacteria bacterium]